MDWTVCHMGFALFDASIKIVYYGFSDMNNEVSDMNNGVSDISSPFFFFTKNNLERAGLFRTRWPSHTTSNITTISGVVAEHPVSLLLRWVSGSWFTTRAESLAWSRSIW